MVVPDTIVLPELRINRIYTLSIVFPFDTSLLTPRMQVRYSANLTSALIVEPSILEVSTGAIESVYTLEISEAQSALFSRKATTYYFEWIFEDALGNDTTYIIGTIPVVLDITEAVT